MPAGITSNFRTPVLILMWENPSLSSNPLRTALGYASAPAVHIGNSTPKSLMIQPKTTKGGKPPLSRTAGSRGGLRCCTIIVMMFVLLPYRISAAGLLGKMSLVLWI